MTQYTQGPIANTGAAYGNSGLLLTANNDATPMFVVCHYFEAVAKRKDGSGVTYRERPEGAANAARLVACWNACEGMDDPAAELATLRAQRDALLADRYALAIELTACANRLDWHSEELTAFPLDVACSKRARSLLERIGIGSAALEGTK